MANNLEERLNALKGKQDNVGDQFGSDDIRTLVEGIEYAMSHRGKLDGIYYGQYDSIENLPKASTLTNKGYAYVGSSDPSVYYIYRFDGEGSAWEDSGNKFVTTSLETDLETKSTTKAPTTKAVKDAIDAVDITMSQDFTAKQKTTARENIGAQEKLNSGTNIKTINNESLLGSGNISIPVVVVDQALSPTSTNPVQNKRIFEALANKVDSVSGKQLSTEDFTAILKQKLESMPTISVDGDVLIINGKEYKLSPVPVVADYYIGWDNGSRADFAAKTDAQILELATGYNVKSNPTYRRAFGSNNIFFLLYQSQLLPTKVVFTSQNIDQVQNIDSEDNSCPHADVVIEGVTYKVFGIRMVTGYDQTDSITINYE